MSRYIGIYMKHCDLCNWTKVQRRRPMGKLHPSETPEAVPSILIMGDDQR
jgi:hypothetical protein